VVRIGVALPVSGVGDASEADIRNQLVKALNEHKADKRIKVAVQAVALEAPPGGRAIAEANGKDCQFIFYSHLTPLQVSYQYEVAADGSFNNVPLASATVEYLVRRVTDGVSWAAGTAKSEASISSREAILQAVERAGGEVLGDLGKGGGPAPGAATESGTLEKMVPAASRDVFTGTNFCAWLPSDIPHADALRGVCEYAMTLPQKMPNFICHEETSRFLGYNKLPTDLVTASVRYEDGDESYSDLKLNGKPIAEAAARSAGLWSSGQLEGNLRAIFHDGNHAVFGFGGEKEMENRAAWVFRYHIAQQNEPLWQLRAADKVLAPAYGGELWVDMKTGEILRFEATAKNLPSSFHMESAEVLIDYDKVGFGDGTGFVLPATSSVKTQFQRHAPTRNVVQFRGCHKFGATARMIVNVAEGRGEKPSDAANAADLRKNELEEDETIYAILREQAIREDAEQLAVEQERDLKWATIGAMSRMAALEKDREKNAAQQVAEASHSTAPASADGSVTTIKVSVKLVPVSVVVRDAKGRAVGGLTKADFQLFDERKPQAIGSFSVEKGAGAQVAPEQGSPAPDATAGGSDGRAAAENDVAYVFDDLQTTFEDLSNVIAAAEQHFAALRPEDRAAVFTTSGEVGLAFTQDREKLQAVLRTVKPHSRVTSDCPSVSYYMADLIVNKGDAAASELAVDEAMRCAGLGARDGVSVQMAKSLAKERALEAATLGRVESEHTLQVLNEVIARTATMPGRRSIVLVSAGFLTVAPEAQDKETSLINQAIEAGIIFNTLDVQGVPNSGISASGSQDLLGRGLFDRQEASTRSEVLADLAYGTGGTFFHNNNDLDQGFRQTADVPEYIYVLGFSPQKLDGKFHKLKVKLKNRERLTVQARAGYYAASAQ